MLFLWQPEEQKFKHEKSNHYGISCADNFILININQTSSIWTQFLLFIKYEKYNAYLQSHISGQCKGGKTRPY